MVRRICLKRRLAWRARPLAVRVAAGALGSVLCFAVMLLKLALGNARCTQTRVLLFTIVRITIYYRVRGTAGLVVIHKCMQWFLTKQAL